MNQRDHTTWDVTHDVGDFMEKYGEKKTYFRGISLISQYNSMNTSIYIYMCIDLYVSTHRDIHRDIQ